MLIYILSTVVGLLCLYGLLSAANRIWSWWLRRDLKECVYLSCAGYPPELIVRYALWCYPDFDVYVRTSDLPEEDLSVLFRLSKSYPLIHLISPESKT